MFLNLLQLLSSKDSRLRTVGPDTRDGDKDRTDNPTEAIVAKYGETQSNLCVRESQEQKG